jgi:hypothetical protein
VSEQGGRIPTVQDFDRFDGLLITGSVYDAHGVLRGRGPDRPAEKTGEELVAEADSQEAEIGALDPFRTREDHVHLHQMHQDHVVSPPTAASAGPDMLSHHVLVKRQMCLRSE